MNSEFMSRIKAAWNKRINKIPADTNCFRLADGPGDNCPGLWLEWFDGRLLIETTGKITISAREAGTIAKMLDAQSVYWKRLDQYAKDSPVWLYGKHAGSPFTVLESGMKFEIDFSSGYSQGIFLDQRDNRFQTREKARKSPGENPKVLNLFAYTCAFSVAAALGGATVTSIDLSAAYLDWGRRNFTLNGIDPGKHFFVKGDVFDWLQAFAKKNYRWQGIIIDPPTFSRGEKKKVFRVEEDYTELVSLAARLTEPNGWLLCCANTKDVSSGSLEEQIKLGVENSGRRITQTQSPSMPFDFTGDRYLKSFWLELN